MFKRSKPAAANLSLTLVRLHLVAPILRARLREGFFQTSVDSARLKLKLLQVAVVNVLSTGYGQAHQRAAAWLAAPAGAASVLSAGCGGRRFRERPAAGGSRRAPFERQRARGRARGRRPGRRGAAGRLHGAAGASGRARLPRDAVSRVGRGGRDRCARAAPTASGPCGRWPPLGRPPPMTWHCGCLSRYVGRRCGLLLPRGPGTRWPIPPRASPPPPPPRGRYPADPLCGFTWTLRRGRQVTQIGTPTRQEARFAL